MLSQKPKKDEWKKACMKKGTIFSLLLQKGYPNMLQTLVSYKLYWYFKPMNFHRVSLPLFVKHMSYSSHKCWSLINIFIMVFMNTKLLLRVCFLGDSICDLLEHDCNVILSLLYKHRLFLTSLTEEKWKEGIFMWGIKGSTDLLQ